MLVIEVWGKNGKKQTLLVKSKFEPQIVSIVLYSSIICISFFRHVLRNQLSVLKIILEFIFLFILCYFY